MNDMRTRDRKALAGPRVIADLTRLLDIARREHGPRARSTRHIEQALLQARREADETSHALPAARWDRAAQVAA